MIFALIALLVILAIGTIIFLTSTIDSKVREIIMLKKQCNALTNSIAHTDHWILKVASKDPLEAIVMVREKADKLDV